MSDDFQGRSMGDDYRSDDLRDSPMMAHLLDALEEGTDIGHYGRLTFVMVARHFLDDQELLDLLEKQPGVEPKDAKIMLMQVKERDYNPPQRRTIMQWQQEQDFPICPDENNPLGCNVYRELRFPEHIYEQIGDYWEERVEAEE